MNSLLDQPVHNIILVSAECTTQPGALLLVRWLRDKTKTKETKELPQKL